MDFIFLNGYDFENAFILRKVTYIISRKLCSMMKRKLGKEIAVNK